jgi:hypothetical protein
MRAAPLTTTIAALLLAAGPAGADEPGWTPLFDGKSLEGWTPKVVGEPLGQDARRTFRAEDGVIRVSYEGYEDFDGKFGHLFYRAPFRDYRLRVEYRFVGEQCPGGPGWALRNSGVMVLGQDPGTMRVDQDFPVSIEVQFLGGTGKGNRPTANLCTPGTLVSREGQAVKPHCVDSKSRTYHGDAWVTVEVEVRKGHVRHVVEGETVLEYDDPRLDPDDPDAKGLIEARGGEARLTSGTISLQSESHPIEFRKVEIQPLGD